MSEPTIQVNTDQILAILGSKEVEIQLLRARVSQLEAEVKKLTPPKDNVVPIDAA